MADLESLAKLAAQPRDMKKGVACPLCRETLSSVREYERHVGRHQEQLALFALPSQDVVDDEGDVEEERSDESAASQAEAPEPAVREAKKSESAIPDQRVEDAVVQMLNHLAANNRIESLNDVTVRIAIIRAMLTKGKPLESSTRLTAANTTGARQPFVHIKVAKSVAEIIQSLAMTQREMANALQGKVQWLPVASYLPRMQEDLAWLEEALDGEPITDLDRGTQEVLGELLSSLALTTETITSTAKATQALVENSNSTGGASTERTMEQHWIQLRSPPLTTPHRMTWACVST